MPPLDVSAPGNALSDNAVVGVLINDDGLGTGPSCKGSSVDEESAKEDGGVDVVAEVAAAAAAAADEVASGGVVVEVALTAVDT